MMERVLRGMEIKTHGKANRSILGTPLEVVDGVSSVIELDTDSSMEVDEMGLVHGGFAFGLADYAAMLAVNHPNVVLGKSESRFSAPVKVGEKMTATATVQSSDGRKYVVEAEVKVNKKKVYSGVFTCYVLDKHVLDK